MAKKPTKRRPGREQSTKRKLTNEEILQLAQNLIAAGKLTGPRGFYIVASSIIHIAEERQMTRGANPSLERISDQMRQIERTHGLTPDQYWLRADAPADWQALADEYDKVSAKIQAATFREFREPRMAELFLSDKDEFDRQFEAGRREIFGPLPPEIEEKLKAHPRNK